MKPITCALLLTAFSPLALAHQFLLRPDADDRVSVLMTEELFVGERLLPVEAVTVERVDAAGRTRLSLQADELALRLLADTAPQTPQGYVVAAQYTRLQTPRKAHVDVPTRNDGFSKALFRLEEVDARYGQVVGHRLELVPLSHPAVTPLRVRVLFDGQPLATRITATHEGFVRQADGPRGPVTVNSDAEGVAELPLERGGLWLLRVRHAEVAAEADALAYTANANLVFRRP